MIDWNPDILNLGQMPCSIISILQNNSFKPSKRDCPHGWNGPPRDCSYVYNAPHRNCQYFSYNLFLISEIQSKGTNCMFQLYISRSGLFTHLVCLSLVIQSHVEQFITCPHFACFLIPCKSQANLRQSQIIFWSYLRHISTLPKTFLRQISYLSQAYPTGFPIHFSARGGNGPPPLRGGLKEGDSVR